MSSERSATSLSIAPAPLGAPPTMPAAVRRSSALVPVKRLALRLRNEALPLIGWYVGRTGRPGLIGLGLIGASALFLFSTHLQMLGEAGALRAELATARAHAAAMPQTAVSDASVVLHALPNRADMPALLGVLLKQADAAGLSVDTGKYDSAATKTGTITRYSVAFPVSGSYTQVRQFIDATLTALPATAISNLSIQRKTIGDSAVEAQINLTFYTRSAT